MKSKPNVVLIFTDNQQASTLACYGNSEVHTPNLDRLASQGMRFDNAYCPNSFCSPCRASLLTGKLPSQHGHDVRVIDVYSIQSTHTGHKYRCCHPAASTTAMPKASPGAPAKHRVLPVGQLPVKHIEPYRFQATSLPVRPPAG